jgi:hypothetical protein
MSLFSFILEHFFSLFDFEDVHILKEHRLVILWKILQQGFAWCSLWLDLADELLAGILQKWLASFSVYHIRNKMMPIVSIIGDVKTNSYFKVRNLKGSHQIGSLCFCMQGFMYESLVESDFPLDISHSYHLSRLFFALRAGICTWICSHIMLELWLQEI